MNATAENSGWSRRSWTRAANWLARLAARELVVEADRRAALPRRSALEPLLTSVRQPAIGSGDEKNDDAGMVGRADAAWPGTLPNQKIGLLNSHGIRGVPDGCGTITSTL